MCQNFSADYQRYSCCCTVAPTALTHLQKTVISANMRIQMLKEIFFIKNYTNIFGCKKNMYKNLTGYSCQQLAAATKIPASFVCCLRFRFVGATQYHQRQNRQPHKLQLICCSLILQNTPNNNSYATTTIMYEKK